MKTLKWMCLAFMNAMLFFNLVSCSNNDDVNSSEETYVKEYVVSLGFKGEITVSDAPLGRASGNDLYGIQVYSCLKTDNTNNYKGYAYGLFDDLEKINIKLIEGYKYKFVATMVVDGKERILEANGYSSPFVMTLTNLFEYSTDDILGTTIKQGKSNIASGGLFERPNLDRYYGEYINYLPSENGNVTINMLRTVFGLKVIANNLTEGTLKIAMDEAPEMVIAYPKKEAEDIFTFNRVALAYSNADYSEKVSTLFTLIKTDGSTIPLGNYELTFKRNKQTIVNVEIKEEVEDVSKALTLSLESDNMVEGDKYTIENNKITNNTVTPGT